VQRDSAAFFPCFDANGNVTEYIDASGTIRAYYAFDAFGNTINQSGYLASTFSHRFSTKYADPETGLYYYGMRFYAPEFGRWVNRDPIEEEGGLNIFGFVGNIALNRWDYLGMLTREQYIEKIVWSGETQYYASYWMLAVQCVPIRTIYYEAFPQVLSGQASNRRSNDDAPKKAFDVTHLRIRKLTVYAKPKTKIEYSKNGRELYEPGIAIVPKGKSPDGRWEFPWSEGPMALNALTGMSTIGGPDFDTSPQSTIKKWSDFYLDVGSVGIYEIHRKIRTCEGDDIVLPTWTFKLTDTVIVKRKSPPAR
jgi:RHS repeat-associated protein